MAKDVTNENNGNSRGPVAKTVAPAMSPAQPELSVVDKRD